MSRKFVSVNMAFFTKHVHLVFVTNDQHTLCSKETPDDLKPIFASVWADREKACRMSPP